MQTTTIKAREIETGDTVTYCGLTFHAHRVNAEANDLIRVDTIEHGAQYIADFRDVEVERETPTPAPQPRIERRPATIQFVRPNGRVRHRREVGERRCKCGAVDDIDATIVPNSFSVTVRYPACAATR